MSTTPPDPQFEALLELLREQRGFDFTGYKRASLVRRVSRRMQQVGIGSFVEYMDHLQLAPDEYTALFNTLLINVTGFFRDAGAWEHLQAELLPKLLATRGDDLPIRVWSAGCATGEEAYTLAIVLCEALGEDEFQRRVKIYGTDIDEEALAQARQGMYTDREVQALPEGLVERYFERQGQRYTFRKNLRRMIIFGRNDMVQDAPISHVHLLACRNTLMYFNAETQSRVLERLHFALDPGGLLLLGKAEMLLRHSELFSPVDLRRRFFRKLPVAPRERQLLVPPAVDLQSARYDLREQAFRTSPLPQVVVAADGRLLMVNERAEAQLGVSTRDVSRPFQDLEVSYRPVELRSLIEEAIAQRRVVWRHEVDWIRGGQQSFYDIQVVPLVDPLVDAVGVAGVSVVFHDVTRYRRLQDELERSNRQLETAYEELQSTNEELETTNEELQSTVEELETTNEELQSTNEELETMNEELQSTNDEFQSVNEELRERSQEVASVNDLMQAVLTSLRDVVVVVDRDLRVLVWNHPAADMWGLRQDEVVGERLMSLDFGLSLAGLRVPLQRALVGESQSPEPHDVVDRRGRERRLTVAVSPLLLDEQPAGAVLVMKPVDG